MAKTIKRSTPEQRAADSAAKIRGSVVRNTTLVAQSVAKGARVSGVFLRVLFAGK